MSHATLEQPTPLHPAIQPPRHGSACIYLLTATALGPVAIVAWVSGVPIHHGLLAGAAIAAAVTACGYIVRAAETRIHQRLDLMFTAPAEAALKEAYDEGHAVGYLAGVERAHSGEQARLWSVP